MDGLTRRKRVQGYETLFVAEAPAAGPVALEA